jgi:5-formyltetrahydrofolate cyclo-ligase
MLQTFSMRAQKDELRRAMRDRRLALAPAEVALRGQRAAAHFHALPEVARARVVAVYHDMRNELPTLPLVTRLRAAGVTICYPRVVRGEPKLHFHPIAAESDLQQHPAGKMVIHEPAPASPEVALTDIDIFLVPGLAFDLEGARVGWGRGYYDHTLAAAPESLRVGFAHELQIVPRVPSGPGDERLDILVTEEGAHRMPRPALQSRRVL